MIMKNILSKKEKFVINNVWLSGEWRNGEEKLMNKYRVRIRVDKIVTVMAENEEQALKYVDENVDIDKTVRLIATNIDESSNYWCWCEEKDNDKV